MIIPILRNLRSKPAYIILGISRHVHNMRCFSVFSTYLILTVFNRHASRLLMIRLSYGQPQLLIFYHNCLLNTSFLRPKLSVASHFYCKKHNKLNNDFEQGITENNVVKITSKKVNKSIDFSYVLC